MKLSVLAEDRISLANSELIPDQNIQNLLQAYLLSDQKVTQLTPRLGGNCGSGVGHSAATAFVIRHGKIVEWRRVGFWGAASQSLRGREQSSAPEQIAPAVTGQRLHSLPR
jgi:hypothetical protein